jgi:outer membrane protein OmpA-like peptidoglycan-associated protein
LNEAARILNDNPTIHLTIEGHTDNAGTRELNYLENSVNSRRFRLNESESIRIESDLFFAQPGDSQ